MHIEFKGEERSKGGVSKYNTLRGYHQGGRGGFRGRGRGGFGRGRELIIFYNCNQSGHSVQYFHNPCMTCTYCRQLDHMTEDCPHLITKWQEKGNQNVQMIVVEENDD
jgi:hypothetical protein